MTPSPFPSLVLFASTPGALDKLRLSDAKPGETPRRIGSINVSAFPSVVAAVERLFELHGELHSSEVAHATGLTTEQVKHAMKGLRRRKVIKSIGGHSNNDQRYALVREEPKPLTRGEKRSLSLLTGRGWTVTPPKRGGGR